MRDIGCTQVDGVVDLRRIGIFPIGKPAGIIDTRGLDCLTGEIASFIGARVGSRTRATHRGRIDFPVFIAVSVIDRSIRIGHLVGVDSPDEILAIAIGIDEANLERTGIELSDRVEGYVGVRASDGANEKKGQHAKGSKVVFQGETPVQANVESYGNCPVAGNRKVRSADEGRAPEIEAFAPGLATFMQAAS